MSFSQTLHSLNRDVFHVSHPVRSIVSRSLPLGSTATHRGFTGHVSHPVRSILLLSDR
jgi:hypothetical protein